MNLSLATKTSGRSATSSLAALAAATVVTVFVLFLISAPMHVHPASEINGVRVVDLAPVQVVVDAPAHDSASTLAGHGVHAALLGAEMAMPYYSFAPKTGTANKG